MKNGNITMIGMAGVGKSTLGKLLAKHSGRTYLDVDKVIEKEAGKTLQEIIDEQGQDAFIEIETQTILRLGDLENTVISPGGSVVYYERAMTWLKANSTVVYLQDTLDNIHRRIPNLHSRGIVGLKERGLQAIFDERCALCESYADVVFKILPGFNKTRVSKALMKELHEQGIL